MPVGNNPFNVSIDPRSDMTRQELPPPANPAAAQQVPATPPAADVQADYAAAPLDPSVSPIKVGS
jgi:hypothetical protein